MYYWCTHPDPTLTVENVIGVMVNVAEHRRRKVWSRGNSIPDPQLEEIYQKYSIEKQRMQACADFYVNCHPASSWKHLCHRLYLEKDKTAVRKAKTFIQLPGEG